MISELNAKEKLIKLSDIISYDNVVSIRQNVEMQDKCRGREATEENTNYQNQF